MQNQFSFENLFVYDLANNHQGDPQHAANIIREVGRVNKAAGARGALKFQFRQLETFIHPDFKARTDHKYVKRFKETELTMKQFRDMVPLVKQAGLLTMSTPFDEESVDVICDMGLDTMMAIAAAFKSHELGRRVRIDWTRGYVPAAIL